MMAKTTIYTVGYGKMMQPALVALLRSKDIERLVDVRSIISGSRVKVGYSKDELEELGAFYRWEPRLGFKYKGQPGTRHPAWAQAIEELIAEGERMKVCVMCAEDEPVQCHRGQWLQDELQARGIHVFHIRRKTVRVVQTRLNGNGNGNHRK